MFDREEHRTLFPAILSLVTLTHPLPPSSQGEAWTDYRLLPEEYRVAAELNTYVEDAGLGVEAPASAPASVGPAPASVDAVFADYASIPSRAGLALK